MSVQEIRTPGGHLVGRISTMHDGELVLRDEKGSLRGTYDPKRDETRDRDGHLIGKGNLLARLL